MAVLISLVASGSFFFVFSKLLVLALKRLKKSFTSVE